MLPRRVLVLVIAGLVAACDTGRAPDTEPRTASDERPARHVILLTLDTLRADALDPYRDQGEGAEGGDARATRKPPKLSPVLDSLARRGVRFDDAIAQAIVTPPSHASILTGLNPPRHGLRKLAGQTLAGEQLTLAEILRDAGFETAAFSSGKPLRAEVGLDQGFDVYDTVAEGQIERSAAETNAQVARWLASRRAGTPTFVWVHYFDPHTPYLPPPAYQRRFTGRTFDRKQLPKGRTHNPDTSRMADAPQPTPLQRTTMHKLYEAEVRYMDDQIGALLEMLDGAGILEDAVIAVVADHGESFGEHGYYFGHWDALYENARVPMLLAHPRGRFAGAEVDATVRTIDLMPTILAWLSIPVPQGLDGLDLTPLIEGAEEEPRYAFTEQTEFFDVFALRGPDWLLLNRSEVSEPGRAMRVRLVERHAGSENVGKDLADQHPDIRDALMSRLTAALHPEDAGESVASPISPETAEQLRALGYLPDHPDE